MIDFTHYIKAKSIVDTYLDNIRYLNDTAQKQHFLVRLSKCEGYNDILDNPRKKQTLFEFTTKELEEKLSRTPKESFEKCVEKNTFDYMNEIQKYENEDIDFYFDMVGVIGDTCALLRNGIEIPDVSSKINKRNISKLIDIARADENLKKWQGTTYVNGVGGLICLKKLKKDLVPIGWDTLYNIYREIWRYYLKEVSELKDINRLPFSNLHNKVYGLTHCIINLTNFYTEFIGNNEVFMDEIKETMKVLNNLLSICKSNNYKYLSDDTLAEILFTLKLCCDDCSSERLAALDSLSWRFDSAKLMFREHKYEKLKDELIKNEHTNILYILNVLF